jgi:hypothetical protein
MSFSSYLLETLKLLYNNTGLTELNPKLLSINNKEVRVAGESLSSLIKHKSRLVDAVVDKKLLIKFIDFLSKESAMLDFCHIGICYLVNSLREEKEKIITLARTMDEPVYTMGSIDTALWYFIGNKHKLPQIEFLPTKYVNDYYLDYWLPHIHLDLFTSLSSEVIKYKTHNIFKGSQRAHPTVVYGKKIYQMRVWLGVVEGINLTLDLKTNLVSKDVYYGELIEIK